LIPKVAIGRSDVWTNNPAFGLNALGGAISFQMNAQLPEPAGRGKDWRPNRHDTGSTTARSGAARLAAIPAGESPANRGVQSLL
jgi:hypothetical protein